MNLRVIGLSCVVAVFTVCSFPAPLRAAAITRIIGYQDAVPDHEGTVMVVGNPVFDESGSAGRMVVALSGGVGFSPSFTALYIVDSANTFQRVASTETPRPGGGTLGISTATLTSMQGNTVYFNEVDPSTFTTKIYRVEQPGSEPTLVAAQGGPAPGGTFMLLNSLTAHSGGVLFEATFGTPGGDSWMDVFNYDGTSVSAGLLGKMTKPAPEAAGYQFYTLNPLQPQVRGGEFICLANAYGSLAFPPNIQGIYGMPMPGSQSQPRKIVDTLTTVPGLAPGPGNRFALPDLGQQGPECSFDTDGNRTVFLGKAAGNTAHGIYEWDGSQIRLIVDGTTTRPGSSDKFKFTGARFNDAQVAISEGKVAFRARDVNGGAGIYVKDGTDLQEIVADGSQVGGVDIFGVGLTRNGFRGNQIVFASGNHLWRAVIGAAPPPEVRLGVRERNGSQEVHWDSQAAGGGAVLEESSSVTVPDWKPVQNPSNPYPLSADVRQRFFRLRVK